MSDPDPPAATMTMLVPLTVLNVGTADLVVTDAAGADTTLKPGQSVDGNAPKPDALDE